MACINTHALTDRFSW